MRSSKWKIVCKTVIFVLLLLLIQEGFAFMLTPAKVYTRLMLHGMYEQETMDLVFAGASHTYRSFDPDVFDEELGVSSYNLGSSSQTMKDSYYVLKEMFRSHTPKRVVLESGYARFLEPDSNSLKSMILTDYFRWSINRVDYFFNTYALSDYPDALFPAIRYKNNLDTETVKKTVKEKLTAGYMSHSDNSIQHKNEWYGGKGFVYSNLAFGEGHIGKLDFQVWDTDAASTEMMEYFEKIVLLCKEQGSELILITAPIPLATLAQMGNYDEAHNHIQQLADRNGLDYYDFNLMRPQVLQRNDGTHYYDSGHMNGMFAEEFSAVAATLLSELDSGSVVMDDWFYPSCDALLEELNTVTHVWLAAEETDGVLRLTAKSSHGKNVTPEYCFVWKKADEDEFKVLQPYDIKAETALALEKGQKNVIRVLARPEGADEAFIQYDELTYTVKGNGK